MKQTKSGRWTAIAVFAFLCISAGFSLSSADDSDSPPWDAPARAARKNNPIAADDKSIAAGKTVYRTQCLRCHGDAGKGDGAAATDLKPKPKDLSDPKIAAQSDGALFWKITTGRLPMPAFEYLTSEDDRWNVINYARTFTVATTQPAQK